MKPKNSYLIIALILLIIGTSCNSTNNNKVDEVQETSMDQVEQVTQGSQIPFIMLQSDDSLEIFLKNFLVPNINLMYQSAFSGSKDDNFYKLKNELKNNFAFLSEDDLLNWNNLLKRTKILLSETKSKYSIEYWTITLLNGHQFPTVAVYEVLKRENKKPPVKEMSGFWGLNFSNLFPKNTTFIVEFAKEPLVYTYEIWLQKKRQESVLEGMTFKESHKIILFAESPDSLEEKQTLIHEFSHIFFELKTKHLSYFELDNYSLEVEQHFAGGAKTSISFTYREFDELMAKLSELIVLPDDKLYEFIKEVSINKMPHYQMTRQLISSTTVYKFLADEHPDEFIKLQTREITDNEIDRILYQMAFQKTADNKNKLRSYLEHHIKGVRESLENVVFK